jgi:hypothetical protein
MNESGWVQGRERGTLARGEEGERKDGWWEGEDLAGHRSIWSTGSTVSSSYDWFRLLISITSFSDCLSSIHSSFFSCSTRCGLEVGELSLLIGIGENGGALQAVEVSIVQEESGEGLARSPGREIWLLEMPRWDLRLAGPGGKPTVVEEEEDEEEGPRVISGTELERFMLPRVTFLCVVFPSRRPQCGWFFSKL